LPSFIQPSPLYSCPVCNDPLSLQATGKSYACQQLHSFDLAKEGYLNLLPVQFKHSKEPGDNKAMMTARRQFLETGFYEPMAKAVAMMIDVVQSQQPSMSLLDLGCGEGYYNRKIAEYCKNSEQLVIQGIDIAKFAVAAAAKKQPSTHFVVGSCNRLPYPNESFDMVLRIFAPSDDQELQRVLKSNGHLLTVTPGPRHLWQLKEFIYSEVKAHAEESIAPLGFDRLTTQRISFKISPNAQQRAALLQMTPFAWHANTEAQLALNNTEELDIESDFILTLWRLT
jgi:23S rRNA (guanine745-N1)-methyltransferase